MGYCSGRYNVQEAVSEVLGRAIHEEVQTIIHETDQNRLTEIEPLVRDCCALDRGRERSEVICPNTSSRISNWHHPGRRTSGPWRDLTPDQIVLLASQSHAGSAAAPAAADHVRSTH